MIRNASMKPIAVLVHWLKNLGHLFYARLGIISHNIIMIFFCEDLNDKGRYLD